MALLVLDQPEQVTQPLRRRRGSRDVLDGPDRLRRPHQRQPVPPCQAGVPLDRHRQRLAAHDPEGAVPAQQRRDHPVDDPAVELVAGNTHAGMTERHHGIGRAGLEPQHGEVAGAAAEVADQRRRRRVEPLHEAPTRRFRLERQRDLVEAGGDEARTQPRLAERVVGRVAGEADRPAHRHRRARGIEPGRPHQGRQEPRDQHLQRHRLAEQPRLAERALRQIALHRHDQPAAGGVVEIGLDRRLADRILQRQPAAPVLQPQAKQRAAGVGIRIVGQAEAERAGAALRVGQHHDAVGGAEIDAEPHAAMASRDVAGVPPVLRRSRPAPPAARPRPAGRAGVAAAPSAAA